MIASRTRTIFFLSIFTIASVNLPTQTQADTVCPRPREGYRMDPVLGLPQHGCIQIKIDDECKLSEGSRILFRLPSLESRKIEHSLSQDQMEKIPVGEQIEEGKSVVEQVVFTSHGQPSRTITTPAPLSGIAVGIKTKKGKNGYCGYVTSIAIEKTTVTTYIPKECKEGSCQYKSINLHEIQHYQDSQKRLEEFNKEIQEKSSEALNRQFTMDDENQLRQFFESRVKIIVQASRANFIRNLKNDFLKFDTSQQYTSNNQRFTPDKQKCESKQTCDAMQQEFKNFQLIRDAYANKTLLEKAKKEKWNAERYEKEVRKVIDRKVNPTGIAGNSSGSSQPVSKSEQIVPMYMGEDCNIVYNWKNEDDYVKNGLPGALFKIAQAHEKFHSSNCFKRSPSVRQSYFNDPSKISEEEVGAYNVQLLMLEQWLLENCCNCAT
jgi:hypothetical protein